MSDRNMILSIKIKIYVSSRTSPKKSGVATRPKYVTVAWVKRSGTHHKVPGMDPVKCVDHSDRTVPSDQMDLKIRIHDDSSAKWPEIPMEKSRLSSPCYLCHAVYSIAAKWPLTIVLLFICLMSVSPVLFAVDEGVNSPSKEGVLSVASEGGLKDSISHVPMELYRLEEHQDDILSSESGSVGTLIQSTIQVWPLSDSALTQQYNPDAQVTVEDGLLRFISDKGGHVVLAEELGIYTPDSASIVLELRVTGASSLRLYWRFRSFPWEEEIQKLDHSFFDFPVTADGAMHTYDVRLDNMDAWKKGRIVDGLKLTSNEAATIDVARVEVRSRMERFSGEGMGTHEYAINSEIRQVWFMRTPARAVYRLRLPERAVFSAGLAAVQDDNPIVFTLCVVEGEKREVLLREEGIGPDTWSDRRVDLAAFAGREVDMELAAVSAKPGQVALWSNPCLYRANEADQTQAGPNILVYLVDALRADRLDVYGYNRVTAPAVTELAQTGVLFRQCFSQETCTKPSVMTLYTGVDSQAHGCTCNNGPQYAQEPAFFTTTLRNLGYTTAAISQNSYAPPASAAQKSFCRLSELFDINKSVSEDTYTAAASYLEQHRDRPFYLYIHTMECHELWTPRPESCPYTPPPPLDQVWKDGENAYPPDRYDGSIAYADYNFKRVRDKLDELGLLKNTLIVFTSDHGYALGERGEWAHGKDPYLDQVHVPLILIWPEGGIGPAVIDERVQLADIGPTLLHLVGLPIPEICQGASLLPLLQGETQNFTNRPVYSFNGWNMCGSVALGDWKLFRYPDGRKHLYFIAGNASETEDKADAHPEIAAELDQLLKNHIRQHAQLADTMQVLPESDTEIPIDPVKLEILKSLGYIGD